MSEDESIGLKSKMSSAKRIRLALLESWSFDIEFITILKSRGPRIEPWGTPDITSARVEAVASRTVL